MNSSVYFFSLSSNISQALRFSGRRLKLLSYHSNLWISVIFIKPIWILIVSRRRFFFLFTLHTEPIYDRVIVVKCCVCVCVNLPLILFFFFAQTSFSNLFQSVFLNTTLQRHFTSNRIRRLFSFCFIIAINALHDLLFEGFNGGFVYDTVF